MVNVSRKIAALVATIALLVMVSQAACSSSDDENDPLASPSQSNEITLEPVEDVVITIGNLTDLTGVSANVQEILLMGMNDLIRYYNDENLIPGVELKVVSYDGQMDPSRDVSGYEWLKQQGANLIYTTVPHVGVTLNSRVNEDKIVLFTPSVALEELEPPGYVFNLGHIPSFDAWTLLKWIADNDWDYQTKGPAKIGAAAWDDPSSVRLFDAFEEYCETHPDQFEWIGGHLAPMATFGWGPEIEALKDCDYVYPPTIPTTFVRDYRNAGYDAKFACNDSQSVFSNMFDDAGIWDEMDGTVFLRTVRWWTQEGELIDLVKEILHRYHSADEAASIRENDPAYLALSSSPRLVLEMIRSAVKTVGPDNFNSQTLYEAAESYSFIQEGIERYSLSSTKRFAINYGTFVEASGADKDLVPTGTGLIPYELEP